MQNKPIEQMPSPSILERCAKAWGLRNLVFVRKMENIVYSCDSDQGKVYLRLTSPLRRVRPEIEAEIHWIEHLAKSGLQVPRLIANREGEKIVSLTEGDQHFEVVVFAEVKGKHPPAEMAVDPQFLNTLGALIAKMHLASETYEGAHLGIKREEWNEERGLRHALEAAANSDEVNLRDRLYTMVNWAKQLPRTAHNYGLIHADLGALNLFMGDDDSISVIDFDDSCHHWYMFDLAIVIFSNRRRAQQIDEKKWISALVLGYRTVRSLSEEEIALIPKWIEFASLRLFFWTQFHLSHHTFHEDVIERISSNQEWLKKQLENTSA